MLGLMEIGVLACLSLLSYVNVTTFFVLLCFLFFKFVWRHDLMYLRLDLNFL